MDMTDVFKRKNFSSAAVAENPWIAEIFENQRWGPLEGWSDFELNGDLGDPLAWQWPNGQANVPPNPPPPLAPGWGYDESPWEIDMNMAGIDEDGWIYAETFADLDKDIIFPKESLPRKGVVIDRLPYNHFNFNLLLWQRLSAVAVSTSGRW